MNRQTDKSTHVPLSNADRQRIKFKNAVLIETCNHIAVVVLVNVRVYVKAMTRPTKCEECMSCCRYIRWQTLWPVKASRTRIFISVDHFFATSGIEMRWQCDVYMIHVLTYTCTRSHTETMNADTSIV